MNRVKEWTITLIDGSLGPLFELSQVPEDDLERVKELLRGFPVEIL